MIRQELVTLRDGRMTPELVFRDPYLLDFLGLTQAYSEKGLESAILQEMESVLLELGSGFCFLARQKRMTVGKYLTELPPVRVLRERLHRAIAYAREKVDALSAPSIANKN